MQFEETFISEFCCKLKKNQLSTSSLNCTTRVISTHILRTVNTFRFHVEILQIHNPSHYT